MPNVYPTDGKIQFMLADAFRVEQEGKLTIIGYMGSEHIRLLQPVHVPTVISISIMYMLGDGEGNFTSSFQLLSSNGTVLQDLKLNDVVKPRDNMHGVIVNIPQLLVPGTGQYTFLLKLNDHSYPRSVKISA